MFGFDSGGRRRHIYNPDGEHRRHMHGPGGGDRHHAHGFGRHGPGHHHRHGGPGRPGRVFEHGDLRYVLLHLIAERPRHGYELIKAIEEPFGGAYSPSPGVIYPTLTLLEELGYLRPETIDGTKKRYSVTAEGSAYLDANRAIVDAVLVRMASRAAADGPVPEIRRALHNLETAVAIRLGRGPLDREQVCGLAGSLDRAAAAVEQT